MKKLVVLLISLGIGSLSAQSAWTKKKGEAFTQVSFSTISDYNKIYGNPDYSTERSITDNTLQVYAEYGLTDKITLIANVPFKLIKTGDLATPTAAPITIADTESGLGNIQLGVKHLIHNKNWVISGQLNVEANTASFNEDSGIRTGYDAWSFIPTINVGRGFDKFYIQAFTGLNVKTNDYSSSFKVGGEIGKKFFDRIWLVGFIDVLKSFENKTPSLPVSNLLTALYVNDQEYSGYGLKALGKVTESFGVTVGLGGAFSGNNVARTQALSFGLYHEF